jgi:hypothetical protein
MQLPSLTTSPKHYPDCCLSLSTKFVDFLTQTLLDVIRNGLVLSIGSGSGLLEAYLLSRWTEDLSYDINIEGVEVFSDPPVNRYLPEEATNVVTGTWDISTRAVDATALLFVYPRQPDLVKKYMKRLLGPNCVTELVIWLGPRADWVDYEVNFLNIAGFKDVEKIDNCGLAGYEMMAMLRRV